MTRSTLRAAFAISLLMLAGCDLFLSPDERVARAAAGMARQDYNAAIVELKNALQDDPDHALARARLAHAEFHIGDVYAAQKDLKRAIELGATAPEDMELAAQIDLALGRADELLGDLDSGELKLDGAVRSLYRGRALLGLQRFEEARKEFDSIPRDDARAGRASLGAAEALAGLGQADVALKSLDALIAAQPQFAAALLTRGITHARRGDLAAAADDLQKARAADAKSLESYDRLRLLGTLTEVQLAQGKPADAARTLAELSRLTPESAAIHVLAGRIALAQQDYAGATVQLQRAVAIAPNAFNARFLLGASLFAQGSPWQAARQLQQVLVRAPENLEARKLLAQIYLVQGRPDSALEVLLPAQSAGDPRLEMLLGLAQIEQGQDALGIAGLERAVTEHPSDTRLKLDLAAAYLKTQRIEKAVELLSKTDPGDDRLRHTGLYIAALSASGDPRRANSEVERLLAARPRDTAVLSLAAAYFAEQHEYERARQLADKAVQLDPRNGAVLVTRASIESAAGELVAAQGWLDRAVAADANNKLALIATADLAQRRGDDAAAIKTLEKLRTADADAADVRLRLAGLYFKQRNASAAQPVIDEIADLGKERPELMNSLGMLYLEAGRFDEALPRFQAAAQQDGANPLYWLNSARTQMALGDSAGARQALDKALDAQPGWMPAVSSMIMLDVKEGRTAEALARIAKLKEARPNDAAALTLEGDVFMVIKQYGKAAQAYAAAQAAHPSGALALRMYRARSLGGVANAAQPLEAWLTQHPGDHAVRVMLAQAYVNAGDRKHAIAQYELMVRTGGSSPMVLNNLAWLYHETGDARALATAREAYQQVPDAPPLADTYGWILVQQGKARDALDILRKAATDSRDPSIEYHYATALARTGAAAEARKRLAALLQSAPAFPEASEARKLLDSLGSG